MGYDHLKDYARFLLTHHLDELVTSNIQRAKEVQLPLLNLFSHLSEEELFAYSKESMRGLLTELAEGVALQNHQAGLERWKSDQIPGVPRTKVNVHDLVFSPHTRKFALLKLLRLYTQDWNVYEAVVAEIDWFYTASLGASLETYVAIQQEELQRERNFFQTVIDHTVDGITAYDKELRVTLWNRAVEERSGITRQQILGKKIFDFLPEYKHSVDGEAMKDALEGQKIKLRNMPYQRREGFYESDLVPLTNEQQEITGLLAVSRDVTERYQVEQELYEKNQKLSQALEELHSTQHSLISLNNALEQRVQERTQALQASEEALRQTLQQTVALNQKLQAQENFLASIIDQTPVSTWIADAEGTMIQVNEACLKLFGVAEASLGIGKYNILKDNTLLNEPVYKDIQAVFREGKVVRYSMDYNVSRVNHINISTGKLVSLVVTIFPIKDTNGKVINVVVQHEDVSEQKKVEEALVQQNKLTKTITDNATSALLVMDKRGYCTFMNPAGEKMLGFSFEEIRQKPLHYMIHHHHPDGSFYPMEDCPIDRALPQNFEIRAHEDVFIRKDGSFFPVLCAASPIFEQGAPVATVIEVRDVTEQKKARQELEKALAETQHKNEELKRINTDLDNFIYVASHDLRAPIANLESITMMLQKRLTGRLSEVERNLMRYAEEAVGRLKHTIIDLTDISRVQREVNEELENVSFAETLQDVQLDIAELLRQSGASVQTDFRVPTIQYARKNLRSILFNLISNAIKYQSPDRSPSISIRTYREQDTVALSVQDNGLGIPKDQLPKLFTMFKRFHAHVEGSGIGLYIVKRIIENHGGSIRVESTEGAGTIFIIYFKETE